MEHKFDSNVSKLEQEIYDISKNINKFKNKNHKTMINMMEKIKSFSEKFNLKNSSSNQKGKIVNDQKKKLLIKNNQNFSNNDISPTIEKNKIYQIKKMKKPINININKNENYHNIDNGTNETETIILYSNQKKHDIKSYLSNINNNLTHRKNNKNIYGNKERHTYKANKSKFFSFNLNDSKKKENDNDIKQKTKSLNEIQLDNLFINNLSNDCRNNDLKFDNKNKNGYYKLKNKNKNKKHIKKVKSYNINGLSKKIVKNIQILTKKKIINSKEIKNVKREHCNINISDYYKNINNKDNNSNKKNNKTKILNHKRLTNYPSSDSYNSNKLDKHNNISKGIYFSNSSRNSLYYSKINKNTYSNKENYNNNTINAKDYDYYDGKTNIPYNNIINNIINDNESRNEIGIYAATQKTLNSLSESIPENNNLFFVNNNQTNYLKEYQNTSKWARNSESSYTYYTNRSKNNISYDINEDIVINKNKINNSNYNKDLIDIIKNKNSDNYKYDFESIYNNNINQKKANKVNKNKINFIKYINIDE